jgi:hypothetical protein
MRKLLVGMLLALPGAAMAQEVRLDAGFRPSLESELAVNLFGISNYRATDRNRRYADLYTKTELATTLRLTESVSVLGSVKFEPVAGGPTEGQDRAFQDQGAWVATLYATWQAHERVQVQAGKFTAPFGFTHANAPGIRLRDWVSDYELTESLGFGATLTLLDDAEGLGVHRLAAAVFTWDTTSLANTYVTRKRFGRDEADRYLRNSAGQGGAGNTGQLDNVAAALSGAEIAALPGFTYMASVMSRGAGRDGTARETAVGLSLAQEIPWNEDWRTLLFAEGVRFWNAGGRPRTEVATEDPDVTEPAILSERRTLATLGARTNYGDWRATAAWQTDQRSRNVNQVPRESYVEVTLGRELPHGFSIDVGWSRNRYARDEGGRGTVDAALSLLSWRASF